MLSLPANECSLAVATVCIVAFLIFAVAIQTPVLAEGSCDPRLTWYCYASDVFGVVRLSMCVYPGCRNVPEICAADIGVKAVRAAVKGPVSTGAGATYMLLCTLFKVVTAFLLHHLLASHL